jgi:hypothetical protein
VWNELANDAIGQPLEERIANRSSAMEDDCWSILALENENSLADSFALKADFC